MMYLVCRRKIYKTESVSLEDLVNISLKYKSEVFIVQTFKEVHAVFKGMSSYMYPSLLVRALRKRKSKIYYKVYLYCMTDCLDLVFKLTFISEESCVRIIYVDVEERRSGKSAVIECIADVMMQRFSVDCQNCTAGLFCLNFASVVLNVLKNRAVGYSDVEQIEESIESCKEEYIF